MPSTDSMASDKKSTGNTPSGALFPPTPTRVAIVMGSASDWPTMRHAAELCLSLEIDFFARIVSAHRTPKRLVQFAEQAADHGVHVIIAGAGGAAHLPGMIASLTSLPVLGVPVQSKALSGMDSLLSIVQMPGGVPVGTLSIGDSGAKNAALLAARVLALADAPLRQRLAEWTEKTTRSVGLTITPDADATA